MNWWCCRSAKRPRTFMFFNAHFVSEKKLLFFNHTSIYQWELDLKSPSTYFNSKCYVDFLLLWFLRAWTHNVPTPLNIVSTRPSPVTFVSTNVCKCIGVQCSYSIVQTEFFNVQPEAYRTAETTAPRYRVNVLRFDLDKAGGSFSFLVTWYNRHHKHLQTPPLWSLQHFFSCPCSCTRSGTHCHIGPHQMRFSLYLNVNTLDLSFERRWLTRLPYRLPWIMVGLIYCIRSSRFKYSPSCSRILRHPLALPLRLQVLSLGYGAL